MSNVSNEYNKAIREHYLNDSERIENDNEDKWANRAEAIGYYSGKIITGYLIGYVLGTILAFLFLWFYVIKPLVIPILQAIINPILKNLNMNGW